LTNGVEAAGVGQPARVLTLAIDAGGLRWALAITSTANFG
jgi:hypothetical protein